jgi:hypothetical protein
MAIQLTQEQIQHLITLRTNANYPEAYRYLRDIVNSVPNSDPRLAEWLDDASHINANGLDIVSDNDNFANQNLTYFNRGVCYV